MRITKLADIDQGERYEGESDSDYIARLKRSSDLWVNSLRGVQAELSKIRIRKFELEMKERKIGGILDLIDQELTKLGVAAPTE